MEQKSRLNYQSCFRKTRLFSALINFLFFNAYFFCSFCDIITCNVPESGSWVFFHKECLSSGWRVAILVRLESPIQSMRQEIRLPFMLRY